MSRELLDVLALVPFAGVPIALLAWAIFQFTVRKSPIAALGGLIIGAGLCCFAFVLFFMNIYCENCAGKPPSPHEITAVLWYLGFGVAMLLALWWTARPFRKQTPEQPGPREERAG